MRFAPLALVALLPLVACRTEYPTQVPIQSELRTPAEMVRTAPDVAGTYQLVGLNDRKVPTRASIAEGCVVELTGGTLTLAMDGRYRFELATRSDCGGGHAADEPVAGGHAADDHATASYAAASAQPYGTAAAPGETVLKEGIYTVRGFEVRFGNKIWPSSPVQAEEANAGPEALIEALFDHGRFDANGAVRDTVLAVTMNDLRTFVFTRPRGEVPPALAPSAPLPGLQEVVPQEEVPSEGEEAREDFIPPID